MFVWHKFPKPKPYGKASMLCYLEMSPFNENECFSKQRTADLESVQRKLKVYVSIFWDASGIMQTVLVWVILTKI